MAQRPGRNDAAAAGMYDSCRIKVLIHTLPASSAWAMALPMSREHTMTYDAVKSELHTRICYGYP
jgi:hypothetical protein